MTAFGPQSANAATALPTGTTTNRYGSAVDTWCQDCTDTVNNNGTVLNAAFYNMILGNLRYAVATEGITMTDGDMTLLWQAIKSAAAASGLQTASNGILAIGTNVQLNLGTGALTVHTA